MEKQHKILIVDDSKEVVAALKAFFEQKYEVITGYNGFEGLQAFEQNEKSIDLVICDLLMPELSGFALISILKKKYPGIPVIAITGWRGNVESSGGKLYADQVVEKPFNLDELDKPVAMFLSKRDEPPFLGAAEN